MAWQALGNVLAVVSDRKIAVESTATVGEVGYYVADVVKASDYYPFGMEMGTDRVQSADGFNGKESDREWGGQLVQDYGFRLYNPALGRFLSVDPLTREFPFYTPYQFAGNKPIWAIDLDGLEEWTTNKGEHQRTAELANGNYNVSSVDIYLLTFDSYQRANNNFSNPPYEYVYSNYARTETFNSGSGKGLDNAAFKLGFSHYLPKRFLDHYSVGVGNEYKLSLQETIDVNAQPFGLRGAIEFRSNDAAKFDVLLASMKEGETKKLNNYTVRGASRNSGTLGNFTVFFRGNLVKTSTGFEFEGEFKYYDIYDFDQGTAHRPPDANDLVRFADDYLDGNEFIIESEWIKVKQTEKDKVVDWFYGKKVRTIQNRIAKEKSE